MNRFCNACNKKIDEKNYLQDGTVCKNCCIKNRKNNNNTFIQNQQTKIDINSDNNPTVSAYENHRHVINGPSNVGKTYYILEKLGKIGNKGPIQIITR